jgi:Family of unknown function (DUF5709)
MADSRKHESEDLEDYEVLDANDTLDGDPGDDPLDRGIVTPDRWSAGVQYALKGEEDSESLDELLDEEEPDETVDPDEDSWDENATYQDVERLRRDQEADPRSGRLVSPDEDTDDVSDTLVSSEDEEVARDTGIDGGGATAEEAAVHVVDDPDEDDDPDEQ